MPKMVSDLVGEGKMRAINRRMKCAYYLLPMALCLFLFACGGNGPENSGSGSTSSGTGTIAFDLEWQNSSRASIFPDGSQSAQQATVRASSDCCVDYGIGTVSSKIFNSSNAQIGSADWPCSAHQGTVTGVPAGSNHWIRIEGTVSGGGICWKAEKTGISVNAGATTQVGSVTIVRAIVIDPLNTNIVYAGTWEGGVWKSTDGGTTWAGMNTGLTNTYITSLAIGPVDINVLYAGTEGGGIFKW